MHCMVVWTQANPFETGCNMKFVQLASKKERIVEILCAGQVHTPAVSSSREALKLYGVTPHWRHYGVLWGGTYSAQPEEILEVRAMSRLLHLDVNSAKNSHAELLAVHDTNSPA